MYGMEKTMLIAGKDMPDSNEFAGSAGLTGRNIAANGSSEESAILCVEWNKPSAISAKSFIIKVENKFQRVDEAVLYFDTSWFLRRFNEFSIDDYSRAADEMLISYEYLCSELLTRFEKKFDKSPATLVFLLKNGNSDDKAMHLADVHASAFVCFAEGIAAAYGDRPFVNIVLAKNEANNEYQADSALARWLCDYIDTIGEVKGGLNAKKSLQWVKAGAKSAGGPSWKLF